MHAEVNPFQPARFPAHGEAVLDWTDGLLLIQARGPFNLQLISKGIRVLSRMGEVAPPQGRYVEVVHWIDSMLMPPPAWDKFAHAVRHFAALGIVPERTLCATAPEVEARWLMLPRMQALWEETRPVELFDRIDDAMARARQLLAQRP